MELREDSQSNLQNGYANSAMFTSKDKLVPDVKGQFRIRHIQAIMLFLCFFTAFFLRINLSVGIVAMTDRNSTNAFDFEEYKWDQKTKSIILSSFFWGYLVIQTPAGQLGQVVSPKALLLGANISCAILSALIPLAARGGWFVVCIIRVLQGLSQGFYVPLSYTLASKWAPPNERNRFVGFSLNGGTLGATAALPLSGLLASSSWGWPSIFYISGVIGLVWCALWLWLGADSPATHTAISEQERQYIQQSLQHTSTTNEKPKTPWKAIMSSVSVWALIAAHIGNGWSLAIVLTELPSYINSILDFDISANGFLSALPYLSMWILTFPVCWLADFVNKRHILSPSVSRKLWTTISQAGGSFLLIVLGFVGHDRIAAMALIITAVSLSAFLFSGFNINHLDLSPNFAGVLMGIGNGLENISTILAPLSVGWIVTDNKSVEQWRWVFILAACVTLAGNIVFVIFGTADIQPWNTLPTQEKGQAKSNNKVSSDQSNPQDIQR